MINPNNKKLDLGFAQPVYADSNSSQFDPSFNVENHQLMQKMPIVTAGTGAIPAAGLGALFAKLTGLANPLLGAGVGLGAGLLSGGLLGANIKKRYNDALTSEELQYLRSQGANV
jgi:hypothetical protein